MYGFHGGDGGGSNLRTVEVCGEHNDGVRQHVGSVCTGEQRLSVEDEIYQGNRKSKSNNILSRTKEPPGSLNGSLWVGLTPGCTPGTEQQTSPSACRSSVLHRAA